MVVVVVTADEVKKKNSTTRHKEAVLGDETIDNDTMRKLNLTYRVPTLYELSRIQVNKLCRNVYDVEKAVALLEWLPRSVVTDLRLHYAIDVTTTLWDSTFTIGRRYCESDDVPTKVAGSVVHRSRRYSVITIDECTYSTNLCEMCVLDVLTSPKFLSRRYKRLIICREERFLANCTKRVIKCLWREYCYPFCKNCCNYTIDVLTSNVAVQTADNENLLYTNRYHRKSFSIKP